jgi:hypothetical protein
MASMQEQAELADLLRLINDRHYDLYKALWKFYSFACFSMLAWRQAIRKWKQHSIL